MRLSEKVFEFLKSRPDERFTARDIANWIFEAYPEECREKQSRSQAVVTRLDTDEALIQQLVAEIGAQRPGIERRWPDVKTTEERPRKYFFSTKSDDDEVQQVEEVGAPGQALHISPNKISEYDLYPILSEYLFSEASILSKRIDEKRSKNSLGSMGNRWLHPDIVGLEVRNKHWDAETRECVKVYGDKATKLWSFEVKLLINRSNVRESFFQTVSNSAWANYGYLVTEEISGRGVLGELRVLSGRHGIGVIVLDAQNPSESQVLIPAIERMDVDWDSIDRLVKENKDFKDFISSIRQYYQTGIVRNEDWAPVTAEE